MLLPSLRDSILSLPSAQHVSVSQLFQDSVPTLLVATQEQLYDSTIDQALPTSATFPSSLVETLLSTFDPSNNPATTIAASYALVTALDMVPFVPCQPLAIALGAKLGFGLAFPITAIGQTTAGVLAFTAARKVSDSPLTQNAIQSANLSPETLTKLEEFRDLTSSNTEGEQGNNNDGKILLALVGLRLAPFFPFSAGNYLLGGTTRVPLRLFLVATLFGCLLSNFISVSVGAAGGALVLSNDFHF